MWRLEVVAHCGGNERARDPGGSSNKRGAEIKVPLNGTPLEQDMIEGRRSCPLNEAVTKLNGALIDGGGARAIFAELDCEDVIAEDVRDLETLGLRCLRL